ncbi:hypothetical protein GCM10011491_01370 [Brucella endophytica]|uniref:Uncharacterized protein n=1 Tax=Brucella endophytica TaxID=1963359 RepID=A0A916S002_9HYPH|nr:hypothetical protein [Brucella endophytica]GGA77913.1 hypothetical protein GCM10011491_01370 [Brucella endophytica]
MLDHEDIRAAADYATHVHRRDAKVEYERWGLSAQAIDELLEKKFMTPAALIDRTRADSLTEDYMQRELSPATFREIWTYRRK